MVRSTDRLTIPETYILRIVKSQRGLDDGYKGLIQFSTFVFAHCVQACQPANPPGNGKPPILQTKRK